MCDSLSDLSAQLPQEIMGGGGLGAMEHTRGPACCKYSVMPGARKESNRKKSNG